VQPISRRGGFHTIARIHQLRKAFRFAIVGAVIIRVVKILVDCLPTIDVEWYQFDRTVQ
jgi:hypothetical protein